MELLTAELCRKLPKLYDQQKKPENKRIIYAKFFFPTADWTWFVAEGSPKENEYVFFGYVIGMDATWSFFTLSELKSVYVKGFTVEVDNLFTIGEFSNVIRKFRSVRGY